MEFIYNDGGRTFENIRVKGDCATRAIAIALNIPYSSAQKILLHNSEYGYKDILNGVSREQLINSLIPFGWRHFYPPKDKKDFKHYDLPKEKVIAIMDGHCNVVIDNNVYDTWDSRARNIILYLLKTQKIKKGYDKILNTLRLYNY